MPKLFLLLLLFPLLSCEVLQQIDLQQLQQEAAPLRPTVKYQDAILIQTPSKTMMAAYFCPQVVPSAFGGGPILCQTAFGAPPSPQQMRVSFDLHFKVANPNKFPIPVAELLTAATVFPDKTMSSLGAACIAFCGAEQPNCTGVPGPSSCQSKASDIKSLADFKQATGNFLISSGIAALNGTTPSFVMPQVVQDAEIVVTARFSFGPDALFVVLKQVASQAVDKLQQGQSIVFDIPYRLQGSVWFDVGSLGRVAVAFGPADGVWVIPAEAVVP